MGKLPPAYTEYQNATTATSKLHCCRQNQPHLSLQTLRRNFMGKRVRGRAVTHSHTNKRVLPYPRLLHFCSSQKWTMEKLVYRLRKHFCISVRISFQLFFYVHRNFLCLLFHICKSQFGFAETLPLQCQINVPLRERAEPRTSILYPREHLLLRILSYKSTPLQQPRGKTLSVLCCRIYSVTEPDKTRVTVCAHPGRSYEKSETWTRNPDTTESFVFSERVTSCYWYQASVFLDVDVYFYRCFITQFRSTTVRFYLRLSSSHSQHIARIKVTS